MESSLICSRTINEILLGMPNFKIDEHLDIKYQSKRYERSSKKIGRMVHSCLVVSISTTNVFVKTLWIDKKILPWIIILHQINVKNLLKFSKIKEKFIKRIFREIKSIFQIASKNLDLVWLNSPK